MSSAPIVARFVVHLAAVALWPLRVVARFWLWFWFWFWVVLTVLAVVVFFVI